MDDDELVLLDSPRWCGWRMACGCLCVHGFDHTGQHRCLTLHVPAFLGGSA